MQPGGFALRRTGGARASASGNSAGSTRAISPAVLFAAAEGKEPRTAAAEPAVGRCEGYDPAGLLPVHGLGRRAESRRHRMPARPPPRRSDSRIAGPEGPRPLPDPIQAGPVGEDDRRLGVQHVERPPTSSSKRPSWIVPVRTRTMGGAVLVMSVAVSPVGDRTRARSRSSGSRAPPAEAARRGPPVAGCR